MSLFHPDLVFRIIADPDLGVLSQTIRGHDEFRPVIEAMCETWGWTSMLALDIIVDEDRSVVHLIDELRHAPTDNRFDFEILDKLTFKDGKILDFIEFVDTQRIQKMLA